MRRALHSPLIPPTANMTTLAFDHPDILQSLEALNAEELDALEFGVIGFDKDTVVQRYNRTESQMAGLSPDKVLGNALFTTVAPCMNNFLVAQRFEDVAADGSELDAVIDYVFTLRMRPSKVKLRLLSSPGAATRYVIVNRRN